MPESKMFELITVLSGRSLKREDTKAVMLGSILAKNLGKSVGDELKVYDEPFQIVGSTKGPPSTRMGPVRSR